MQVINLLHARNLRMKTSGAARADRHEERQHTLLLTEAIKNHGERAEAYPASQLVVTLHVFHANSAPV